MILKRFIWSHSSLKSYNVVAKSARDIVAVIALDILEITIHMLYEKIYFLLNLSEILEISYSCEKWGLVFADTTEKPRDKEVGKRSVCVLPLCWIIC